MPETRARSIDAVSAFAIAAVVLLAPGAAVAQSTAAPTAAATTSDLAEALERRALGAEARADYAGAFDAFAAALGAAVSAGAAAGPDAETRDAAHARAEVHVLKLEFAAEKTARFAELERVLAAAFESPPGRAAPPLLRARATHARARAALARGDAAGAKALAAGLGYVSRFAIAGPFDNERGGGFHNAYGPEKEIDLAARYEGKVREVGWVVPPADAFLGEVDLDAVLRPNDECLAYALAYIFGEGDAPQPAALRIGSDEGLKVWWNDGLALARDAYRTREIDQDVIPVVIRPGWNRLLLKVAERRGAWGLAVRITDPQGGPVRVRQAPPELAAFGTLEFVAPGAGTPGSGKAGHAAARGAIDHYERRAADPGVTAHELFHLGYVAYRARAHDENEHPDREAFKRAVALAPGDAVYRAYLGFVSAQSGEFSVNREENARRVELERALEAAPDHARIAVLLGDYYLRSLRNAVKAEACVDRALRANPDAVEALLLKGEILERQGFDAAARLHWRALAAREDTRRLPEALVRLARVARARGDMTEAERLYRAALAGNARHDQARHGLVEVLWARGDHDGALAGIEAGLALGPATVAPRLDRARILEGAGKLVEAEREIQAALEIAPEDDAAVAALGRIALRLDAPERALELFGRALALNPKLVDVRKHMDFLREERPFEEDHKLDVEAIVAAAKAVPVDPEASARKLLYLVVDKVNRDGTSSEFVQEVVRIENQDGVDAYDVYAVRHAVGEQKATFRRATVIRKDGRREEARIDTRGRERAGEFTTYARVSVDLPALEVGDIVVLEHRVDDLMQGFFGDYFGKTFYFQDLEPIERTRFVLVVPADRRFHFNRRGIDVEPAVRPSPDGRTVTYVWERTQVPRLEAEPDMPPLDEVLPCVQVSTFADWDAFARWYWSLIRKQFEVSDELRAKCLTLVAAAPTREAKVRAIYDFVVTDIRYNDKWEFGVHGFKPYNATAIFARRFGDCKDKATLIATMLGVVGIPAYPVLIDGQSRRGAEDFTLPLMSHFNHCIAYVPDPAGGEGWFLDGTAQHHEAANLPAMDRGATCLVVRADGGELKRIPWPEPFDQGIRERHKVLLAKGGGATIESELEPTGRFASGIREVFVQSGQRREMLEKIYGRELAGVQVLDAEFGDLADLGKPVKVKFRMQVPKLVKSGARGFALEEVRSVLFRWLYAAKARDLASKGERRFDVILPIPSGVEEVVEYTLPEGLTVRETPKPAEVESEFGRYRKVYEVEGRTLRVRRHVEMRAQRVPVSKYEEFRRFAVEVDRADEARAILGEGGTEE